MGLGHVLLENIVSKSTGHFKIQVKVSGSIDFIKPWHMGTHPRVGSESYPVNANMTGFRCFSKI